jgi:ADP-ribosyl-[dinitrogen reductase] hydrolase
MLTRREQIEGGLIGLLVGDALGVPYEFHPPDEIPRCEEIEFTPPPGFRRAHAGVPPGTWSDDGAQALGLLASLLDCGKFDAEDFGRRLVAWYDEGYLAVDGRVFDIGIQTGQAIRALRSGTPALQAGGTDERSNGNGSLMRVLPLVLWHRGTDEELVADAHAQSQVTHAHLRSQMCCALYCLWARRVLAGEQKPWGNALTTLRQFYGNHAAAREELDYHIRPWVEAEVTGSGYVVDCLRSALWASNQGEYEAAVKAAISLGRDTDTTACVTGGIAGLRDGIHAIPQRWRDGLRGQELVVPLLQRLLDRN